MMKSFKEEIVDIMCKNCIYRDDKNKIHCKAEKNKLMMSILHKCDMKALL